MVVFTTSFKLKEFSLNTAEIFLQDCFASSSIHHFTNSPVSESNHICPEQNKNSQAKTALL
jgi:hypothetical protein